MGGSDADKDAASARVPVMIGVWVLFWIRGECCEVGEDRVFAVEVDQPMSLSCINNLSLINSSRPMIKTFCEAVSRVVLLARRFPDL